MGCIFCGSSAPLTREHVFPLWMADALGGETTEIVRSAITADGNDVRHARPGVPTDTVTKSVCAECNNGWMSALEERVRPVLEPLIVDPGSPRWLSALDQDLLAVWATKTLLTLQETNLQGERVVSREDARWFHAKGRPLPASRVWLGRYAPTDEDPWPLSIHQGQHIIISCNEEVTGAPNAFNALLAVGPVVLWMFGSHADEQAVRVVTPDGTIPVWPVTGAEVRWPPPAVLGGHADLRQLCFSPPISYGPGGGAIPLIPVSIENQS